MKSLKTVSLVLLLLALPLSGPLCTEPASDDSQDSGIPWWAWLLILFAFTFCLGIVAVVAGIGGSVLFVPIVSGFFPFHLDFVRGTGLLVALTGGLSAGPGLLRRGLTDLKLAFPMCLIGSVSAIFGARTGLALPPRIVEIALGGTISAIALIMAFSPNSAFPEVGSPDRLSAFLGIGGTYFEESLGSPVTWRIHRTILGMVLFVGIGFMGGMFGLGAGWANVPLFNLLLGAPLKVSVATSVFALSINGTAAAWVYLNSGAVLPLIAVPSVAGIMFGTRVGVKVLARSRSRAIRIIVIGLLLAAGIRSILKGVELMP